MSRRLPQAHMVRMPVATIASDARIAAPDGAGRDRASPWHLLVLSCSRDRSSPDRAAELRRRLRPAPPRSAWLGGTLNSLSLYSICATGQSPPFGNPRANSGEVDSATLRGGSC